MRLHLEVSPIEPGKLEVWEVDQRGFCAVKPTWWHGARKMEVSNITRLHCLNLSNRETLYKGIVSAMLRHLEPSASISTTRERVPFEVVIVARDGRCGWRCILASADVSAYNKAPRTLG